MLAVRKFGSSLLRSRTTRILTHPPALTRHVIAISMNPSANHQCVDASRTDNCFVGIRRLSAMATTFPGGKDLWLHVWEKLQGSVLKMSSTLKKRRAKMNKHKRKKRRKLMRCKNKK
jgi:hypothetical protein